MHQVRGSMWSDMLLRNGKRQTEEIPKIRDLAQRQDGNYLNMGCGPHVWDKWINIDKYYENPNVLNIDMYQTPFSRNTAAAIYSSHSLEHLPIRKARKSLMHWSDLLIPERGRLYLAIPDLEEICRKMLDPSISDHTRWNWFIYTMYGYQTHSNIRSSNTSLNLPDDPGQYHQCGFTLSYLNQLLEKYGLSIIEQYKYVDADTPSIWTVARKDV